jgi:hypothetical protein
VEERYDQRHSHGDLIERDRRQAPAAEERGHGGIEKPAIGDPGFVRAVEGKEIGERNRVMLQDPLAGSQMPPDVRVRNVECANK